jgi:non-heme chloroperoxidase
MELVLIIAVSIGVVFVLLGASVFALVASRPPPIPEPRDIFGFGAARLRPEAADLPPLRRHPAGDGERLAYRLYESAADQVLIFVHGSSYHGAAYHALAEAISTRGAAKVVLPNLRGHYQSGRHRGDIDYIGQLEDDLADLIAHLRDQRLEGPIVLGGHSSGGGLVIRFAAGAHAGRISRSLMLSPIIPTSPAVRGGTAGGWANLHARRMFGLLALNAVGIHGFDGLAIIDFNKPVEFWDGTETLSYSYRLNTSCHPDVRYQGSIRALNPNSLVVIGANDQANDPEALRAIFAKDAPDIRMETLTGVDHFGVFSDPVSLDLITDWLATDPR